MAPGGEISRIRLTPTSANREPSAIVWLPDGSGRYSPNAVLNLHVTGDRVRRMTGFQLAPSFFDRIETSAVPFGAPDGAAGSTNASEGTASSGGCELIQLIAAATRTRAVPPRR